jgi:hypothetical protein
MRLTSVTFDAPSKLSRIEQEAFSFSGLAAISIPASVQIISDLCFLSCESLHFVDFDSNSKLDRIEGNAFLDIPMANLSLPGSVNFISGFAFIGTNLQSISFSPVSSKFCVLENFLEHIDKSTLIRYFGSDTELQINSRVKIVGDACFSSWTFLQSVTFAPGSQLSQIDRYAFSASGLIFINIPASVEVIGESSFSCCLSLLSVTFDSINYYKELSVMHFLIPLWK